MFQFDSLVRRLRFRFSIFHLQDVQKNFDGDLGQKDLCKYYVRSRRSTAEPRTESLQQVKAKVLLSASLSNLMTFMFYYVLLYIFTFTALAGEIEVPLAFQDVYSPHLTSIPKIAIIGSFHEGPP